LSELHDSNLAYAARFISQYYARILGISLLVLIPCFWLPHAGWGDFPSHVYNAWLAPQVERGELPGLTLAHQHTNVLTDAALECLIARVGVNAAQRGVLSASVLLMFWGMFAIVAAISGRTPWWLMPVFAMLTYGWAFHLGFLNSYVSTAICFWIFALLWSDPKLADILATIPLVALAVLAHPVPFIWLVGTLVFGWIVRRRSPIGRWWWLAADIAVLIAFNRFAVTKLAGEWIPIPLLNVTGADQFYIFRARFYWLAVVIGLLGIFMLSRRVKESGWKMFLTAAPTQMYLLTCAAVFLLPVAFIPPGQIQRFGFFAGRLSLMAAVLGCALIAPLHVGRRTWSVMGILAICFFWFVYTDELQLDRMESKVEMLIASIPPGQRVAALLYYPRSRYEANPHALDRACIGRCWSYGNYEPSAGQFRIRANGLNPYVLWKNDDMDDLQHGRHVVIPTDLPLYQIYACGPKPLDLCIRALQAGERNGAIDRLRHW
jgi:hypothetical protein